MEVYIAGDYGGLRNAGFEFYYGYEQTVCKNHCDEDCENCEWAFVAKRNGKEELRIGWSELGVSTDQFSIEKNLLAGIGYFLEKNAVTPALPTTS